MARHVTVSGNSSSRRRIENSSYQDKKRMRSRTYFGEERLASLVELLAGVLAIGRGLSVQFRVAGKIVSRMRKFPYDGRQRTRTALTFRVQTCLADFPLLRLYWNECYEACSKRKTCTNSGWYGSGSRCAWSLPLVCSQPSFVTADPFPLSIAICPSFWHERQKLLFSSCALLRALFFHY